MSLFCTYISRLQYFCRKYTILLLRKPNGNNMEGEIKHFLGLWLVERILNTCRKGFNEKVKKYMFLKSCNYIQIQYVDEWAV